MASLGKNTNLEENNDLIKQIDLDSDGFINYDDFVILILNKS